MGSILTAYQNKTPLIITAGNQTRVMLLLEPWLTNIDPDLLPRPWVKWTYTGATGGHPRRAHARLCHCRASRRVVRFSSRYPSTTGTSR